MEGDTTRCEFENELDKNTVQFVKIRDKNVNFILWQFQRFVLYLQKEYFGWVGTYDLLITIPLF